MKSFATLRTLVVAALAAAVFLAPALADTVRLKDGTVLEGEVVREIDGAIYFKVQIGGVSHTRLILANDIESIERVEKEAPGAVNGADGKTEKKDVVPSSNATRIAFITLEDTVGEFMNADALEHSVELLDGHDVDIVVIRVNSGGGAAAEVEPLSDVIEEKIKPKYRVVGWIESAISAACLTIWTCEDLYMTDEGNIGGAVAFTQQGGRAKSVEGAGLEWLLRLGEKISRRGNKNPIILKSMQVFMTLSCDIDESGRVTWYDNDSGRYIVSRENQILTLNSVDGVKYGVIKGVANTKDELAALLVGEGVEWVEVGHEADAYQQEFRENVATAKVKIQELMSKMQIAAEAGQASRARRFLGEIRAWVTRAPSLEDSMGLTPEWFRDIERRIREGQRSAR